jgi:D-arabinose 5-phosphate isomerase GutQ
MPKKLDYSREAKAVWAREAGEISRLADSLDPKVLERCVAILSRQGVRIHTAGVGTSAAAARKIAHSFCCIGRSASFLSPGDAVHGGLGAVSAGDVVIAISKGGNTREIVNILPAIKKRKAYLIGVTENPSSILGVQSDLLVRIRVEKEADGFNMLATASTLAVVAWFDAVCVCVMKRTGYSKSEFGVIHPSGAVGDRLLAGRKR